MKNLDLREILKDVPKGTILYSTTHGNVYFDCVDCDDNFHPIKCYCYDKEYSFTKDGKWHHNYDGECCIFPSKEQRDWNKFELHYQFKVGDVIYHKRANLISIYKGDEHRFDVEYYTKEKLSYIITNLNTFVKIDNSNYRLATQEERKLFYDELQRLGYFWNGETKSLEKYKFEVGHCITTTGEHKHVITQIKHNKYIVTTDDKYLKDEILCVYQENFNFYQEKFDITTLKPYDKVLVRNISTTEWMCSYFSHINHNNNYCCNGSVWRYCIPYNDDTKHLIGTNNTPPEKYQI